ncbi:hypothetical protein M127_4812 [Bacteroides fragilis str. S6L5]|nr:hypothetical protein M127_4812 [Bacteroides fragilis str. S6L5]
MTNKAKAAINTEKAFEKTFIFIVLSELLSNLRNNAAVFSHCEEEV